jgi:hypothetical protein
MATISILIAPGDDESVGHVTIAIGTSRGTTYVGFGPNEARLSKLGKFYARGQFDVEFVPAGASPTIDENNYANPYDHQSHASFSVRVSDARANAALDRINELAGSAGNYNIPNWNVCVSIAQDIAAAAGIEFPGGMSTAVDRDLRSISDTLGRNPKATSYPGGFGLIPIPEGLRSLQEDYAFLGRGFDTPREMLGTRPQMRESSPDDFSRYFTPPTFDNRWDNLFPAASFDQRWGSIPDPVLQTAQAWLDRSRNPASGNLNPILSPSQSPQNQEGRRLQDIGVHDIGVMGPQDQDLPLSRSALAWMNLENTPLGVLRTTVSPNVPADVWNDVFAGPTFANNGLAAAPDVAGSGGAPVLDAPFEQDPAAPNANMGPMTSLAELGSGYRNAGLGNSSFGNFADYGTGDFGDYGYGGLDRYGISIR